VILGAQADLAKALALDPGSGAVQRSANYAQEAAEQIAEVYAWRGEKDQAFQWLERAYQQRDGGLATIKYDPLLASLRGDARFAALLRKMKLP
jgi:hypothetical protein